MSVRMNKSASFFGDVVKGGMVSGFYLYWISICSDFAL